MYNTEEVESVVVSEPPHAEVVTGSEVDRFLALGARRGWNLTVVGRAPLPDGPVELDAWQIVPVAQDLSPWTTRAVERVNKAFNEGLRPKGFVIIHEIPSKVQESARDKFKWPLLPSLPPDLKPRLTKAARAVGLATLVVGVIAGVAVLAVAVMALAAILLVPAVLIAGATGLDPILCAVVEDGDGLPVWIEIDRWNEKGPEGDRLASALRRYFGG